jgi:hypothetical protein
MIMHHAARRRVHQRRTHGYVGLPLINPISHRYGRCDGEACYGHSKRLSQKGHHPGNPDGTDRLTTGSSDSL